MFDLFSKLFSEINARTLMERTEKLLKVEMGQTFKDYHNAVKCAKSIMDEAGLDNVEVIDFPADGKTAYQDKRMPLGWNATIGKLTIKKSAIPFDNPVVADFSYHPFHLIKGSTSTPKGGMETRIITEAQLFSGEDPKDTLVMADPQTAPRSAILKAALDLGALGIISDFLCGRYKTPDAIQWVNACTEGSNWHVQAEDRPFIGFSVSPRTGDLIRNAANKGELIAHVECDGECKIDRLPMVTGILPGKNKRELWILSHLFEPLADDNSSGVAAAIETARAIKTLSEKGIIPPLNFTLRLVFAMEFYGFAAYAEHMGGYLGDKTIGAINTDGLSVGDHSPLKVFLAPPAAPFFGDYLMELILKECAGDKKLSPQEPGLYNPPPQAIIMHEEGMYGDDAFLNDPTVGLPTQWIISIGHGMWHNSAQMMNIISPSRFKQATALIATWVAAILTLDDNSIGRLISSAAVFARKHILDEYAAIMKELLAAESAILANIEERMLWRFGREKARLESFGKVSSLSDLTANEVKCLRRDTENLIAELKDKPLEIGVPSESVPAEEAKLLAYAASIIPARKTRGFPYELVNVPKDQRIALPDGIMYGPMARILAGMDGKKNLGQLLREVEWETNTRFELSKIKKYIDTVIFLNDYGYLDVRFDKELSKKE